MELMMIVSRRRKKKEIGTTPLSQISIIAYNIFYAPSSTFVPPSLVQYSENMYSLWRDLVRLKVFFSETVKRKSGKVMRFSCFLIFLCWNFDIIQGKFYDSYSGLLFCLMGTLCSPGRIYSTEINFNIELEFCMSLN